MESPRERTISTATRELAALAWGPESGPPVLALHGWLDNAASFSRLAPLLEGMHVVAIDLPGHGRSPHNPPGFLYPFVDHVADAWRVIEALGWDRCALLGHSLGAGICSMLAGTHPDHFSRVVLLEGLGPLTEPVERTPERLAKALADETKRRESRKRIFPSRAAVVDRLAAAASPMEPDSARGLVERGTVDVEGGVTWAADPAMRVASRLRFTEEQVHAFLRRISAPTLLLRARSGWPVDPEVMGRRRECVRDIQRVEVDGHHHVHLDQPERVAAHVVPFLAPLLEAE